MRMERLDSKQVRWLPVGEGSLLHSIADSPSPKWGVVSKHVDIGVFINVLDDEKCRYVSEFIVAESEGVKSSLRKI